MKKINATIKSQNINYNIFLGSYKKACPLLNSSQNATLVIITDQNIADKYLTTLKQAFKNTHVLDIIIPNGDEAKNLASLEFIINKLSEYKITKKDFIVGFGGGAIGDISAFVASIYMRGIGFINIATTLLAQIDAAIGGKTAINTSFGKNLIGSFYHPNFVIIDSNFLQSLDKRSLRSGYAEMLKYGLINDYEFFYFCEQNYESIFTDQNILDIAIEQSIKHKLAFITEDPFDKDKRNLLNLGHSFAHALERFCGYSQKLLHGEAVAIGLVLAFQFSAYLRLCSKECYLRIAKHLQQVHLPYSINTELFSELSPEILSQAMKYDKKNTNNGYNLILAKDIGKAFMAYDIEENILLDFFTKLLDKKNLVL